MAWANRSIQGTESWRPVSDLMVAEGMTEGYPLLLSGVLNLLFSTFAPCWIVNCRTEVIADMLGPKMLQKLQTHVDYDPTVFTAEYAAAMQTNGCALQPLTEDGWFTCSPLPVGNVTSAKHNITGEFVDWFAATLHGVPSCVVRPWTLAYVGLVIVQLIQHRSLSMRSCSHNSLFWTSASDTVVIPGQHACC